MGAADPREHAGDGDDRSGRERTGSGILPAMAWLLLLGGVVATLQGVAWTSGGRGRRRAIGTVVAMVGVLALVAGLTHVLLPSFLAR
jgi:hypothetical protein